MYQKQNSPSLVGACAAPSLTSEPGEVLVTLEAARERVERLEAVVDELQRVFEPALSALVPEKAVTDARSVPPVSCPLSNGILNVVTRLDGIGERLWSLKNRCRL